jgi:hypothetical protein
MHDLPYFTTADAARMAVSALEALAKPNTPVRSLQSYLSGQG